MLLLIIFQLKRTDYMDVYNYYIKTIKIEK